MSLQRVFMTGRGALSASGSASDAMWTNVLSGKSAIAPIEGVSLTGWTHSLGGEIKSYRAQDYLADRKLLKLLSKQDVLGLNAAEQALKDSRLLDDRTLLENPSDFNEQTGVYVASPGNKYQQQYDFLPLMAKTQDDMQAFAAHLMEEVHPMWLLRILPNNVLAYTSMLHGFKGENHNIVNHAVGGMQAIIEAYHAISRGLISRAVVVAYDVGIEPQALFYYARLGVLSQEGIYPFDKRHDGTILAEGAAALVLESEASLLARGRTPYAEIVSGASATEGGHLFTVERTGTSLAYLLKDILHRANVSPSDLNLVVAHGNGNPVSDISEAHAMKALDLSQTPITSFKWSMGHTLCASGVMDTVLALHAMSAACVPGLPHLQDVAMDCQGLHWAQSTMPLQPEGYTLVINRGFGGMNAGLLLKACVV